MQLATLVVAVAVVALSLWVMLRHMGLAPGLDFGAGAYYYADIPEYERYFRDEVFTPGLPQWVYYLLFFGWGFLMWRLWIWVARKFS